MLLCALQVSFDKDVELTQMNEYEILQILMGDCRERLAAYKLSFEEDVKLAQQRDLTPKARLACKCVGLHEGVCVVVHQVTV